MRPDSLAEVARLTASGEPFAPSLANFLEEFYRDPHARCLTEAPELLAPRLGELGRVQDAYLAATAEELSRLHALSVAPWIHSDERKLRRPWFASDLAALRAILIFESPAAFRSRNLFVSHDALTRA